MGRNTSIALGNHFQEFVDSQVGMGKYASVSEVIRAALRMLEDYEAKIAVLKAELQKGEQRETITSSDYNASFMQKREHYLKQIQQQEA